MDGVATSNESLQFEFIFSRALVERGTLLYNTENNLEVLLILHHKKNTKKRA